MTPTRTPEFLMANLGSEVSRLLDCKERGDMKMAQACLERAHGITKQIAEAPSMQSRAAEINTLHDVINDVLRDNPKYKIDAQVLKAYFYPFASRIFK